MFCKKCGNILNDGEMFCGNCGAQVENQIPPQIDINVSQQPTIQTNVQENPTTEITNLTNPKQSNVLPPKTTNQPNKKLLMISGIANILLIIAIIVVFNLNPSSGPNLSTTNSKIKAYASKSITVNNANDKATCDKIKKEIKDLLSEEDNYEIMEELLLFGDYIFEIKAGGVNSAVNYFNQQLEDKLSFVKAPKEKGRANYYVCIESYDYEMGEIYVTTWNYASIPTAKDFDTSKEFKLRKDYDYCTKLYSALDECFEDEDIYDKLSSLMKNDYLIFEIKPDCTTTISKKLNTQLKKYKGFINEPLSNGYDTYYVYITPYDSSYSYDEFNVDILPGKSGSKPNKKYFDSSPFDDISEPDVGIYSEKNAISTDASTCTAIESCVNAALANEDVYKETAKLGNGDTVTIIIKPDEIIYEGEAMIEELESSLDNLKAPKQKGKDVYYVEIETEKGGTYYYSGSDVISIGKVSVSTASSKDLK